MKIQEVRNYGKDESSSLTENKYNVSTRLWNKFTTSQKAHYNNIRDESQIEFILPTYESPSRISDKTWDVIAHNFAVIAALNLRTKKQELRFWEYLKKKLKFLKDNNVTAREIFERVTQ